MREFKLWFYGIIIVLFVMLIGVNISELLNITKATVTNHRLIVDNEHHVLANRIYLLLIAVVLLGVFASIKTLMQKWIGTKKIK